MFVDRVIIDPEKLNQEKFKVKSVFIVSVIFYKYNDIDDIDVSRWLKNKFSPDNYFSRIIDTSECALLESIKESLLNLEGVSQIDVAGLYEMLLGVEPGLAKNCFDAKTAKNYRNKLGSYYTPPDLARLITFKTIDAYFDNNYSVSDISKIQTTENISFNKCALLDGITTMSFVDFSCGGGNFLMQIVEYFKHISNTLDLNESEKSRVFKSLVLNIHAFDVDCVALEVAKIIFLIQVDQPALYEAIEKNFIHANFLLHDRSMASVSQRIDTFTSGYIYHQNLSCAIDMNKKYDVIIGNPPWEKIRFEEKKFYALYANTISTCHFKSTRSERILSEEKYNKKLAKFSKEFRSEIDSAKLNIKKNTFFSLSDFGELNTYALFTEASIRLRSERGVVGLVVKSAIITSQINKNIFRYLSSNKLIINIYDFINRKKIFNIDSRERFCYMLLGSSKSDAFSVAMNLTDINDIGNSALSIRLTQDDLNVLNPDTGMLPNISSKYEADFLVRVSSQYSSLKSKLGEAKFGRIVHFTNHSEYIEKKKRINNLPVYEGKFFHQFDGKYSGFNGMSDALKYKSKSSSVKLEEKRKSLDGFFPESRYYIDKEKWEKLSKHYHARYMLVWRSLTSATNTRTCIATLLPFVPASQSVQFLIHEEEELIYLAGLFNSMVFDYIVKKKLSGIDLTRTVLEQIPIPDDAKLSEVIWFDNKENTIKNHILNIVHSLVGRDSRLAPLFASLRKNNAQKVEGCRSNLIRKLDLLFIVLYELSYDELKMVLSSFSGQYSEEDEKWFNDSLIIFGLRNKSVCSTNSTSTAVCPI
ncbi:MAG: hypothetical protein QM484_05245 [Woeseiaceae bacterium]